MKQLIVNADDFGISLGVNQGILQAHREGLVTSTTVMANLPLAQEIVEATKKYPNLGVGIHLNITYGKPVLVAEAVPSLVNEQGNFRRPEICYGQVQPEEVAAEWRAQLALFQGWGLQPTHLDSHHHVHLWPELLEIAASLAQELEVPVRAIDDQTRHDFGKFNVPTADHFIGNFYGEIAQVADLIQILHHVDEGVTELMCHPAIVDEQLAAHSGYVWPRNTELASLIAPEALSLVTSLGIQQGNYKIVKTK